MECEHIRSNFLDDFFRALERENYKYYFRYLEQYTVFQFLNDFSLLFYVLYILFYDKKEFYIIW